MDIIRTIEGSFQLVGGDFADAGESSMQLKQKLTDIGLGRDIIKRAAIVAFEAEMNVIIHAAAGWLRYYITKDELRIVIEDMGPGIADIELAMKEGYSTAPEWVKDMGWGAGMGMANMKRNSDEMRVDSVVGEGTTVDIIIKLIDR
ncbi:MAG: anti-sigma regulatory factor [Nitrospirae bacterium]|nr:anti-sigma regulatory factor [Nitrospirota bacterium]